MFFFFLAVIIPAGFRSAAAVHGALALVSTHTYINPLVAVLPGGLFAAEYITLGQVAALVVVLIGVLLINIPGYKKQLVTSG